MLRVLARERLQSWTPGVSLGREGGVDRRVGGQGLWRGTLESGHGAVSSQEGSHGQNELSWGRGHRVRLWLWEGAPGATVRALT